MVNSFMRTCFFFFGLSLVLLAPLRSFGADPSDTTYVRFNTTLGNIDVQLLTHEAPQTVANFLYYVNNTTNTGNYCNVIINRNVPGFVFQGGAFNLIGAAPNEIALNPLYPDRHRGAERGWRFQYAGHARHGAVGQPDHQYHRPQQRHRPVVFQPGR